MDHWSTLLSYILRRWRTFIAKSVNANWSFDKRRRWLWVVDKSLPSLCRYWTNWLWLLIICVASGAGLSQSHLNNCTCLHLWSTLSELESMLLNIGLPSTSTMSNLMFHTENDQIYGCSFGNCVFCSDCLRQAWVSEGKKNPRKQEMGHIEGNSAVRLMNIIINLCCLLNGGFWQITA